MRQPVAPTLGQFLSYLLPRLGTKRQRQMPVWPPDVFALCAAVMVQTGAYTNVLTEWPPESVGGKDWQQYSEELGRKWRGSWSSPQSIPKEIRELWNQLLERWDNPVRSKNPDLEAWNCLVQLAVIADEASYHAGAVLNGNETTEDQRFSIECTHLLRSSGTGASLCSEISTLKLRVLPKTHTPQVGLTFRSLTHNLCLVPSSEVIPEWITFPNPIADEMNLLVIPFPYHIGEGQVAETQRPSTEMKNLAEGFGFFTFHPANRPRRQVLNLVKSLFKEAKSKAKRIHGVVMPELSVSTEECELIASWVIGQGAFFVCGHGLPAKDGSTGSNFARVVFDEWIPTDQAKHHRWRLDKAQIDRYGILGLSSKPFWWECIPVHNRYLYFHSMGYRMTMAVLICEDLARPDPAGEIIRAVGPNLIIALLMDGPNSKIDGLQGMRPFSRTTLGHLF